MLSNILSQMGLGNKQLTERLSPADFGITGHDPHMTYAYEPSPHPVHQHIPVASSKHHHSGGGHKNNAAMSALTLLAFLFFLNILQQCLKEHMMVMSTPQVVVMTGGREGEENIAKTSAKTYKSTAESRQDANKINSKINIENTNDNEEHNKDLMKIYTEEHTPKITGQKYKGFIIKKNYENRNSFPGFVSAMDDK